METEEQVSYNCSSKFHLVLQMTWKMLLMLFIRWTEEKEITIGRLSVSLKTDIDEIENVYYVPINHHEIISPSRL